MNILVVDDEALIRMLTCDLLEDAGFSCTGAADAEHALMLLDSGLCRPDMLISDFNLGRGLDGKALAREVQLRFPGLPTVFVTGNPECFAEHRFQPCERILAKPFAGTDLVAAVNALRPVIMGDDVWRPDLTLPAGPAAVPGMRLNDRVEAHRRVLELDAYA